MTATSHWPRDLDWVGTVVQHGGAVADPYRWNWAPSILVGTAVFLAIYLYGVGPLRRRWGQHISSAQLALFLTGVLIFFLSLVSPLDALSDDYLFSAHMVQHIFIGLVVPPLLLLGTPGWLLRPLVRRHDIRRVARFLTHPATAFLLFNGTFAIWHWPAFYDLAVADDGVHAVQHLTFLATGVLNWWPVLSPLPELPRLSYPLRVLYLFANCQPGVALGALFVLSRDVLYQSYVAAPRLFEDLSPYADQQLGGLIMWVPGNAIYLLALSIVFLQWFQGGGAGEQRPSP